MWSTGRVDKATTTLLQAQAMPASERHQTLFGEHRQREKTVERNCGNGHAPVAHSMLTTGTHRDEQRVAEARGLHLAESNPLTLSWKPPYAINGTYGGVRGERKSPYSIAYAQQGPVWKPRTPPPAPHRPRMLATCRMRRIRHRIANAIVKRFFSILLKIKGLTIDIPASGNRTNPIQPKVRQTCTTNL